MMYDGYSSDEDLPRPDRFTIEAQCQRLGMRLEDEGVAKAEIARAVAAHRQQLRAESAAAAACVNASNASREEALPPLMSSPPSLSRPHQPQPSSSSDEKRREKRAAAAFTMTSTPRAPYTTETPRSSVKVLVGHFEAQSSASPSTSARRGQQQEEEEEAGRGEGGRGRGRGGASSTTACSSASIIPTRALADTPQRRGGAAGATGTYRIARRASRASLASLWIAGDENGEEQQQQEEERPRPLPVRLPRAPTTVSSCAPPTLKLYGKRKPVMKGNRLTIMNALRYSVFPGPVDSKIKDEVLAELAASEAVHFLLLLRGEKGAYRGTYGWDQESSEIVRIHGRGPPIVNNAMMQRFYKFDNGGKRFNKMDTKMLTITTDGFTIKEECWQKPAIPSAGSSRQR